MPNLFLVASGPIPPNPSELLASERMHNFLAMARERFDFVILDTPPALAVTDATLIGSAADGVVLCFRAGKVQRDDTRACRDRLLRADVRILGAVLNRYHERGGRYGKRYHQYTAYAEEGATESALGGLPPPRSRMIDLHLHVLPGIDDGAAELRGSASRCAGWRRTTASRCW